MTQSENRKNSSIDEAILKKWRRDITKFNPVIKINSKGDNTLGHTAPFPKDIPEMAIKMFSFVGEKVLDPFAGSFTSAIVAVNLDRIGIGIELGKKEFEGPIMKNIKKNQDILFSKKFKIDKFDLSKEKKLNKQLGK